MNSISNYIKTIAKAIKGRTLKFLGTGPSTPITDRQGKSNRKSSSVIFTYKGKDYRIDVPLDLDPKIKFDYLLVTHLHDDAFGGFDKLIGKFTFGIPVDLAKKVEKEEKLPKSITVEKLRIDRENKFGDLKVTPFEVTHDIVKKFKTFGYRILFPDNFVLVYISDILAIPEKIEQYFEKIDLLIIDGSGWNANIDTHQGMWPFLELIESKDWKIKKIYFTHIGRAVPDHETAQKELNNRFKDKATLAYDGLEIEL
jgi:phosphoribosyl 1,2-cyclic phosphodiesterase